MWQTIAKTVGDWYFSRGIPKEIDCPYPCDKTCHNLIPTAPVRNINILSLSLNLSYVIIMIIINNRFVVLCSGFWKLGSKMEK